MIIRRTPLTSLVAFAAIFAAAGFYSCGQQQKPADANAAPQAEARPVEPPAPAYEPETTPPTETRQAEAPRPKPASKPPAHARPIEPLPPAPVRASDPVIAATPTPPAPPVRHVTVPEGAEVHMTLDSPVGSATSLVGDIVTGTTTSAVVVGTEVAIPAGSTIHGEVTSVDPATKGLKVSDKGGSVVLSFTKVTTPSGVSSPMSASVTSAAKSSGKTAGIIGGSAAGGAILGKILGGHTKDAAIGAVIGGGIGTGIAAGTKGKEVVLPAGTDLSITLDQPLTITGRS